MDLTTILAATIGALVGGVATTIIGNLINAQFAGQRHDADLLSAYQLASIDKRLKAHQKAYSLMFKLTKNMYDPRDSVIDAIVLECQTWWVNNSLYLHPDARDAFWQSMTTAHQYRENMGRVGEYELKEQFAMIMKASSVLEETIGYIHRNPSLPIDLEKEN